MFSILSFSENSNLLTAEVIGNGTQVYEVLIEKFPQVVKILVSANSSREAFDLLSRRFVVKFSKPEIVLGSQKIKAYRINAYSLSNGAKPFTDMIIRRVQ